MPPGHDIEELIDLIVRVWPNGKAELVADPKARTIQLR